MNPYYRVTLPPSANVTVAYHSQTFPLARYVIAEKRYDVRIPANGEARILPGTKFLVETVWEGAEPISTDPVSSIPSPRST